MKFIAIALFIGSLSTFIAYKAGYFEGKERTEDNSKHLASEHDSNPDSSLVTTQDSSRADSTMKAPQDTNKEDEHQYMSTSKSLIITDIKEHPIIDAAVPKSKKLNYAPISSSKSKVLIDEEEHPLLKSLAK